MLIYNLQSISTTQEKSGLVYESMSISVHVKPNIKAAEISRESPWYELCRLFDHHLGKSALTSWIPKTVWAAMLALDTNETWSKLHRLKILMAWDQV